MALAQGGLAALADELEAHAGHDLVNRIVETERVEDEGARNIVGFGHKNEPTWARNTDHLIEDSAGIGRMDQDGLAGHEVEARIGEW